MNFMLLLALLFIMLSIYGQHRIEWITVAAVTALVWLNLHLLDHNDTRLYFNRAIITFAGAAILTSRGSFIGYYHATIFALTLLAYSALALDVSQGRHILIYNNYEAVIYGLVGCQLIGIFPTVWAIYRDIDSSASFGVADIFRAKEIK